ncbi:MAG TPA: HEAT repeat domain-containing protein [Kofleriaceae bacterium]|nr:HEAT repeat domain-containing protein [Kofleriaceae bacterium]
MPAIHPPSNTITFEAALRDLGEGSPRARTAAAQALGGVAEPEQRTRAVEALLVAVRDRHPETRTAAAMSLGDLEREAAVQALGALLDDAVPMVRQAAGMALGKLGFRAGIPPLLRALRDGPADLRFQAATSLVEIDAEAAYEPLVAALADEDGEVLGAVALGLGAIGDARAIGHLAPLVEHHRSGTRIDAAYALVQLGDGRGRDVLVAALRDPDQAWDAIEALEKLGDPGALDPLIELATAGRIPDVPQVRAASAVLALDPAGPHAAAARGRLEAGLQARKLEVAALALESIERRSEAPMLATWARDALIAGRATRRGRRLGAEIDRALAALSQRSP